MLDPVTFHQALENATNSLSPSRQQELVRSFGVPSITPPPIQATGYDLLQDFIRVAAYNAPKITDSRLTRIIEKTETLPEHFRSQARKHTSVIDHIRQEYGGLDGIEAYHQGKRLLGIIQESEKHDMWKRAYTDSQIE